jgi:hypothetical protein
VSSELRVLKALGDELERVAASPASAVPRRGLDALRHASVAVLLAAVLGVAAAATAAVLLIRQGSSLPAAHTQDLQAGGVPLSGTVRLAGLDAPDPAAGSPPWDLRVSRTRDGEICTAVGQVLGRRFGVVGLDDVFRALPLGSVDVCSADPSSGSVLAGAREFVGRTASEARTVVSGVAGADALRVTAYGPGSPRRLPLGPDGSFITVYRGEPEEVRPRIVVASRGGRSQAIAFEQSSAFEVPDSVGGTPWVVSTEADLQSGAGPDEDCVQAIQEPSQAQPNLGLRPMTPEVCGHLSAQPLFVLMRRFVPESGRGTPFPWGNAPARTLVYGIAAPRVTALSLEGTGAVRQVPINRHGGSFLVVLDGHLDPSSLALAARLNDGTVRRYRGSFGLLDSRTNRPISQARPPAYRAPSPAAESFPPFQTPIQSSVGETLHATDPAGGATWVVRSWRGAPNARVTGVRASQGEFICMALGVLREGHLVEPSADPSVASAPIGPEQGRCNQAKDLVRMHYMLSWESFLKDPFAYAPLPARTVVSGVLPPGASDATLFGAGPPRRLTLDGNGAFLMVLPGRFWTASPHIVYRLGGKVVGSSHTAMRFPLGRAPEKPESRAPDPDGAAPWGFAATRNCSTAIGRIVEGRLATLDERTGVLSTGPEMTGGSVACITKPARLPSILRGELVEFDTQRAENYASPSSAGPPALTLPEIERRTPPGRTIITAVALPQVSSITLSTPADVRTLRPSGPLHTIIAVYDGYFLRGKITATIRLADGQTKTENIAGGAGVIASNPQPASLHVQLVSIEQQLAEVRRPRPGAHGRFTADGQLVRVIQSRIDAIKRRIAYRQGHPDLLPAE